MHFSTFGQMPTFFCLLYIFYKLFITFNKRKKWESGQKARKPSIHAGFAWPNPFLKVGKSPLFLAKKQKSKQISLNDLTHFRKSPNKSGQSPFFKNKSGQKKHHFLA
jgi:hypothetical protein